MIHFVPWRQMTGEVPSGYPQRRVAQSFRYSVRTSLCMHTPSSGAATSAACRRRNCGRLDDPVPSGGIDASLNEIQTRESTSTRHELRKLRKMSRATPELRNCW